MFCCDGKDASMIFCPEFFVDALWWPRPYPQLKCGAMWQCQRKGWSHELVQVLHVHNIIWCLYLSLHMEDCIWCWCWVFFPRFATHKNQPAGWVTLAPCCRTAMSTALTYKLMIILRKLDQDSIRCWIHVHDDFFGFGMTNWHAGKILHHVQFNSVYSKFLILNRLTV